MTNKFSTDVLICGAGAAGLTVAIDLARRGVRFRIIDKLLEPFHGSRGKGIQPRTQEIFEDLGIIDRIVAAGGSYPLVRQYLPDGTSVEVADNERHEATAAEPYHLPLMIPQFLTERILRERLAEFGKSVEFGTELTSFEKLEDGVIAGLRNQAGEQTVQARFLVGADGGRSFVRHALAVEFPGKTLGVRAIVADARMTGLSRDAWHHFNEGDMRNMVAICPLAGTDLFQIQAPVALEGDVDLSAGGLTQMIAQRTGRSDIVVEAVSWASVYSMNARLADQYRVDQTFLVGDAAHIHPPTGGQGLNTSVQDAYNLGWKLAAVINGSDPALLDTYEEERRPVAAAMLGLTEGLLEATKRGDLKRGRQVSQLDIGYAGSSIAFESGLRDHGLPAGSRAPDAPLIGAGGQPVRVFNLLKGPHWTLFVANGAAHHFSARAGLRVHKVGSGGEISDSQHQFADAYGLAEGEAALIRPDGYIGAVSDRIEDIEAYLARVGLGPVSAVI
jgi:2-polyprenyl-6-methoxyphenol hydroxylase-like FAD-dependent oxidoreductase